MHVWRPLFVVLGIVALILVARQVIVPKDFGVYGKSYTYGWHRKSTSRSGKQLSRSIEAGNTVRTVTKSR